MGLAPGWDAYWLDGCTDEKALESCADSVAVNKLLCSQGVEPREDGN